MLRNKTLAGVLASIVGLIVLAGCTSHHGHDSGPVSTGAVSTGDLEPKIPHPKIPAGSVKITDFGAVADGKTSNTLAIAKAIESIDKSGGGTVVVPAGTFLTGPIRLVSNLNFHLEKDALLLFSDKFDEYPVGGFAPLADRRQSFITITGGHDVMVSGEGKIEGQGKKWWDDFLPHKGDKNYVERRPKGIVFDKSVRCRVEGVTLMNFPMFHMSPTQATDVTIENVTVRAPGKSPNTDSCNPSGWNIWVNKCDFSVGDDNIAVKPFVRGENGRPSVENIWITNCKFGTGHGLSVGGQTPGGLKNMHVRNISFDGTDTGLRLKSERGDGGVVEDVTYENITMNNVKTALVITSYYHGLPKPGQPHETKAADAKTPIWRNILFKNVKATNVTEAGLLMGLPEMPLENITLQNVDISAQQPMRIGYTKGLHFENVKLTVENGAGVAIEEGVEGDGLPGKK